MSCSGRWHNADTMLTYAWPCCRRLVVGANLETEQLFKSRVQGAGWSVPSPTQKVRATCA